ncbi:MAG: hypothetical protein HKM95_00765 [Inquilinus sp.]|nr:hypothetical protein [Inquilinus sp.]
MNDISKTSLTVPVAVAAAPGKPVAAAPTRAAVVAPARPTVAAPTRVAEAPPEQTAPKADIPRREVAAAEPAAQPAADSTVAAKLPEPVHTTVTGYTDASTGHFVMQVRKVETKEVVSQYPAAELLRFYAATREALERTSEAADAVDLKQDVSA